MRYWHLFLAAALAAAPGRVLPGVVSSVDTAHVVSVPVYIQQPFGRPTPRVELWVDGAKVPTVSAVPADLGIDKKPLLIALDISRSMLTRDTFATSTALAAMLVSRLPEHNDTCLITIGKSPDIASECVSDKRKALSFLQTVQPTAELTLLRDGLMKSLSISPRSGGVLVVLTDGNDEGSAATIADISHAARLSSVAIFFAIFDESARTPNLRRLAAAIGAEITLVRPGAAGREGVAPILTPLADGYSVSARVPRLLPGPHWVTVEIDGITDGPRSQIIYIPPSGSQWAIGGLTLAALLTLGAWAAHRLRRTPSGKSSALVASRSPVAWLHIAAKGAAARAPLYRKVYRLHRSEPQFERYLRTAPEQVDAELYCLKSGHWAVRNKGANDSISVNGFPVPTGRSVTLNPKDQLRTGECVLSIETAEGGDSSRPKTNPLRQIS